MGSLAFHCERGARAAEVRESQFCGPASDQLRPVVQRMLRRYGYTVVTAADAEEALEVDARHPGKIGLLISDSVMPGLSGLELAHTLRAHHPNLRVLLTSGYPTDAIVDWPAAGIEREFIAKPFLGAELASKVRDLLDG